jgi:hypothetical protein
VVGEWRERAHVPQEVLAALVGGRGESVDGLVGQTWLVGRGRACRGECKCVPR